MIGVSDATSSAAAPPVGNTSPVWRRAWHPVAPAADVTGEAPAQALVAGEAWVLARLDGRLVAFEDQCPHRLSPLSAGDITRAADGTARLTCVYHGWRFDAAGRCDHKPPPGLGERLLRERWRRDKAGKVDTLRAAYGVTEAYGLIWLAPRQPLAPLPAFPEWGAPGITNVTVTTVRTSASASQLVGNFLDAAQLPDTDTASPAAVEVTTDGWQLTGVFAAPDPAVPGPVAAALPRLTKTAGVSGTAHARLELPSATIGILLACQPEDWMTTRVFTLIASGGTGGAGTSGPSPAEAFVKAETEVLAGDRAVLGTAWRRLMARASATVSRTTAGGPVTS
jgi:nitrite reductase/ring-hydroxylating ferredoxin subunit